MNELAIAILEDSIKTREHCLKYSEVLNKEEDKEIFQKQIDELKLAVVKLKT